MPIDNFVKRLIAYATIASLTVGCAAHSKIRLDPKRISVYYSGPTIFRDGVPYFDGSVDHKPAIIMIYGKDNIKILFPGTDSLYVDSIYTDSTGIVRSHGVENAEEVYNSVLECLPKIKTIKNNQ